MNKIEVRFGDWIEKGINLYKANFAVLAVAGLLTCLLSFFSLLILAGPMMAGLTMVVLALQDGAHPKPQGTDVMKGFGLFVPALVLTLLQFAASFGVSLVLGIVPCIGPMLSAFGSWAVLAVFLFSYCLVVDRKLGAMDAIKGSLAIVRTNFWMFLAFGAVANLIGMLGMIACGIGVMLTMPATVCMVVVAYRDVCAQQAAPTV